MGWLLLLLLAGTTLLGLRLLKVRGAMFLAAAAALLFGAAGYALQGRPNLDGSPASRTAGREIIPLTQARHAFYGNFSNVEQWLRLSEGLARAGHTEDAVGVLQNAVRRYPGDPHLWVGLGNALVDHSRGITPPAELAYKRAAELSPEYPAPAFFYGLALARSGDGPAAARIWQELLTNAPAVASWRSLIEQGLSLLNQPAS